MNRHFRIVTCTKQITHPKWYSPLISRKSQLESTQDNNKTQHKVYTYMVCKLTYTILISQGKYEAQDIQTHARNKTNTCKGAMNFQCIYNLIQVTARRNIGY